MPRDDQPRNGDGRTFRGYKVADFARLEGVDRDTVRSWMRKGAVRVSRLGKGIGVRVDYLEAPEPRRGSR
jgi:hypothetical protein